MSHASICALMSDHQGGFNVLPRLDEANFDPEFFKRFEGDMVDSPVVAGIRDKQMLQSLRLGCNGFSYKDLNGHNGLSIAVSQ